MNNPPHRLGSMFKEDNGTFSMMRFVTFIGAMASLLIIAAVLAFMLLYPDRIANVWGALLGLPGLGTAGMLGTSALKVIQKKFEQKVPADDTTEIVEPVRAAIENPPSTLGHLIEHTEIIPLAARRFVSNGMEISEDGLQLVQEFEGLKLEAYKDEVGVWTIGWGHTGLVHQDGTVYPGRVITHDEAEDLLRHDMNEFGRRVNDHVRVVLAQNEFDALVSFDFNTGGLPTSTLLRLLNADNRKGAAEQFLRWNKAGGRVLRGLTPPTPVRTQPLSRQTTVHR